MKEIVFQCSECGKPMKAFEYDAGSIADCPSCGNSVVVPSDGSLEVSAQESERKRKIEYPPAWKFANTMIKLMLFINAGLVIFIVCMKTFLKFDAYSTQPVVLQKKVKTQSEKKTASVSETPPAELSSKLEPEKKTAEVSAKPEPENKHAAVPETRQPKVFGKPEPEKKTAAAPAKTVIKHSTSDAGSKNGSQSGRYEQYKKFAKESINFIGKLERKIPQLSAEQQAAAREIIASNRKLKTAWKARIQYIEERDKKIAETAKQSYNKQLGDTIQAKFAEYTRNKNDWGYNSKCIKFSQELAEDFKNPQLDPNIHLEDVKYKRYSGSAMKAVSSGRIARNVQIYEVLISRYADPSELTVCYGGFPLSVIKYGVPSKIVQHEFNIRFTVRSESKEKDDMEAIEILLCEGAVPEADHLASAVKKNRVDIVAMLLAYGVDPNAVDKDGETALFNAYRLENGKMMRNLLLAAGVDPDITSNSGKKAQDMQVIGNFMAVWKRGFIPAIDNAFRQGVDVNMRLADNNTLLHDACKRLDFELVKVLFKHKVNPNVSGRGRYYPIAELSDVIFRISKSDMRDVDRAIEIFKFMVKNGATISTNPLGYGGNPSNLLWRAISSYSQTKSSTAHNVKRKNRYDTFSNKLNKRYHDLLVFMIDYTDDFKPDHWSCICWKVGSLPRNTALKLLDKVPVQTLQAQLGSMFNASSGGSMSPAVVYALARKEVKFNEIYKFYWKGKTLNVPPLYIAVMTNQPPDVIEALLKNGADPRWKDEDGNTALDITQNAKVRDLLRRGR